jgi:hypothetical protein
MGTKQVTQQSRPQFPPLPEAWHGVVDRRDNALTVDEPDRRSSLFVLQSNLIFDVPRRRSVFERSSPL